MLICANGTFKSGSTWLFHVLRELVKYEELPDKYQHKIYNDMIDESKLKLLIDDYIIRTSDYVVKTHIYHQKGIQILMKSKYIYVFNIDRDIKDLLVSHYYHLRKDGKIKDKFKFYYWAIGRYKAYQIFQYKKNWDEKDGNVYHLSFRDLKENFEGKVREMAKILNINVSDADIEIIKDKTSIEKLRKSYGEEGGSENNYFFRKGVIGEGKKYFDSKMQNDLLLIMNGKIGIIFSMYYYLVIEIRLHIKYLTLRFSDRLYLFLQRII